MKHLKNFLSIKAQIIDEEILKKYSLPLFCEVMFRNIEINYLRNAFKD